VREAVLSACRHVAQCDGYMDRSPCRGGPAAATPAPRRARAAPQASPCAAPGARSAAAAGCAGGAPREGQRHGRDSVAGRAPDEDQGIQRVRAVAARAVDPAAAAVNLCQLFVFNSDPAARSLCSLIRVTLTYYT
jgi:hypothetical protein